MSVNQRGGVPYYRDAQTLQVRKDLKRAAGRVVLKFWLTGELVKELKTTDS